MTMIMDFSEVSHSLHCFENIFYKTTKMIDRFFLTIIFSYALFAQSDGYQIGGYGKYLLSSSDLPGIGRVTDHLFHARFNSRLFITEQMTFGAELRNRIVFGGSVENIPNFLSTIRAHHDFENFDIVWWENNSSVGYSELDRLWFDATVGKFQFTIGRQRVAWGTALVWNPTDLFNPLAILDFDYEERPGVDAVRIQYFNSEVSKIEVVVKPGKTRNGSVIAAKILLNNWKYDFHFLGGIQGNKSFAGFSWSGDIEGAGFRGELFSSQINDDATVLFPALKDKWSSTTTLSADYTFPNTLYIHSEILYNDRGVTSNASLAVPLMRSLQLLSPARWSFFQEVSSEIHPLLRASVFIIVNPNDGSNAFVPSATWSAMENFDISFFGLFFSGNPQTEYGSYGTSVFVRGKYSF
jgi:hypothetical protein